jgi:hypothetical protein
MIAVFRNENSQTPFASFSNIVDMDLSFYSDIFLSNIPVNEFKVSFSYDHLLSAPDDNPSKVFAQWVKGLLQSSGLRTTIIWVIDTNGQTLAEGNIFEWSELLREGMFQFVCTPKLTQQIYLTYNNNDTDYWTSGLQNRSDLLNISFLNHRWREYFTYFFGRVKRDTDVAKPGGFDIDFGPSEGPGETLLAQYTHLSQAIVDSINASNIADGRYFLRVTNHAARGNSFKNFIKELSKLLMSRLVYRHETNIFEIQSSVTGDPIAVKGYVSAISLNTRQSIDFNNFINEVSLRNTRNQKVMTINIEEAVRSRLIMLAQHEEYSIWGYANTLLVPGNTISLGSVLYIIKDIKYETETLDSIKSFNAICTKL